MALINNLEFHVSDINPNDSRPLYLQIADSLEERILRGELPAESRLPNTAELSKQFQVTVPTMHQALARLADRGLLRRTRRLGTFVNIPTFSTTIGLVFGGDPFVGETAYYALMLNALREQANRSGYGIDWHQASEGTQFVQAIRRLEADIRANRYRCLLTVGSRDQLHAWMKSQDLIPAFAPDSWKCRNLVRDAVAYLLARGFRRILVVSGLATKPTEFSEQAAQETQGVEEAFKQAGIGMDPSIFQYWGGKVSDGYHAATRLFSGPRSTWPDALFINHDVLTKGALMAFAHLGLKIPQDMALLTHANQGDDLLYPIPLTRLELDLTAYAGQIIRYVADHWKRARPGLNLFPVDPPCQIIVGKSCGE